jgi:hypothetical protein
MGWTTRYLVGSTGWALAGLTSASFNSANSRLVPSSRRGRSIRLLSRQLEHELLPSLSIHSGSTSGIVDLVCNLRSLLVRDDFDYRISHDHLDYVHVLFRPASSNPFIASTAIWAARRSLN